MWARATLSVQERFPDGSAEVVGYIADITAEREAEAKAVAAARLASLGEMTSGLAHELMQPLLTMSLASENALRPWTAAMSMPPGRGCSASSSRCGGRRSWSSISAASPAARRATCRPGRWRWTAAVEGALVLVGAGLREAGVAVEIALGRGAAAGARPCSCRWSRCW